MKRTIPLILVFSLLLSGCANLLDGSYIYVQPHRENSSQTDEENITVATYDALLNTLRDMVEAGVESRIISVAPYDQSAVSGDLARAVEHLMTADPYGAYAVADIFYDLGTSAGQPAVAVDIDYLHGRSELRRIQRPKNWDQVEQKIADALANCDDGMVMYLDFYHESDFSQWVASYAATHPDIVMELPTVTANFYPEQGSERIIELKFTYQNTRDALRGMQTAVARLFSAASIYASSSDEYDRFFKLYSFLMGLSPQFLLETSITPAYSLLQHGVGDSRAFATVYAAMCVQEKLECVVVTGTKNGEPWYWNIICCDDVYYHVDLLECHVSDAFSIRFDDQMSGYVWDYSAYPICVEPIVPETVSDETQS